MSLSIRFGNKRKTLAAIPIVTDGAGTEAPLDDGLARRLSMRLALLAIVAMLPAISIGYLMGDDDANFLDNVGFRGIGWRHLRWAWTTTLVGVYQPISWMLLEAQYALWGMNPKGYHYVSLAFHALNVMVLFWLTIELIHRCRPDRTPEENRRLTWASAASVALFAVHPLRAEVVSWMSCQPYLPCALVTMLTVLAYLEAHNETRSSRSRMHWLIATFFLWVAAILSKAPAITLPLVLLVLDVYPLRRIGRGRGVRAWLTTRRSGSRRSRFSRSRS